MFQSSLVLFLRPRHIKYTPPPLSRRAGHFKCRQCKFWWNSNYVWVTDMTEVCYQAQQCERCGALEKPYYVKQLMHERLRDGVPPLPEAETKTPRYHVVKKHAQMNRGRGKIFVLLSALLLAAAVTVSAASVSSFVVTFTEESLKQNNHMYDDDARPPFSVLERIQKAISGRRCIVTPARSWTLHIFCSSQQQQQQQNDDIVRLLAVAEPTMRVEPLHHHAKFDAHAARLLDKQQEDGAESFACRGCCVAVRMMVHESTHPSAAARFLPPSVTWTVSEESGRKSPTATTTTTTTTSATATVFHAVACPTADDGAKELLSLLKEEQQHREQSTNEDVTILAVSLEHPVSPSNWYSRGVLSNGNPGADFFKSVGVQGQGVVIGVADTGIDVDHCFFDDPQHAAPNNFVYDAPMPGHRKILRYKRAVNLGDKESGRDGIPGHGTHVAGTLAGSPLNPAAISVNVSRHHGVAPLAKLSFVDIGAERGLAGTNPLAAVLDDPRHDGAFVHSDSWGSESSAAVYTDQARQADAYMQAFDEFLVVFASGNDADKGCMVDGAKLREGDVVCDHYSVLTPGTCKNGLAVGSSVAPLASWQEADYGNFVVQLHLLQEAAVSGDQPGRGGPGLLATFDAVHAQFGANHPALPAARFHFVQPADACGPLSDPEMILGAIAVVYRGTCVFTDKAEKLQRAGALMMLVINTEVGPGIQMGAAGAHTTVPLTISAVMISKEDGAQLKQLQLLHTEARLRCSLHETARRLVTKNRHDLSGFSGRGPTNDMRYKPDLVAIGEFVHSAASDGDLSTKNCNVWASMGTSMATPQVSAMAALMREYLQRELHLPKQERRQINSQQQQQQQQQKYYFSSAGIKAMIILAAVPLTGVVDRTLHGDVRDMSMDLSPSFEQGHGILRIASVLPNYEEDDNTTAVVTDGDDDPRYTVAARQNGVSLIESKSSNSSSDEPLAQGAVRSFCFEYKNSSVLPFRAVLSWTDPVSNTPGSDQLSHALLNNDLDLIVDDSAGRRYRGNKHGANPPEVGDDRNNVEKVHAASSSSQLSSPSPVAAQFFLVSVHAKRVVSMAQHFALAVSSGARVPLEQCLLASSTPFSSSSSANRDAAVLSRHGIGCKRDADCDSQNKSGSKCLGGTVCLCARGFRGSRCQLAPMLLPHTTVDERIYPMQFHEYAFLLTRRLPKSSGALPRGGKGVETAQQQQEQRQQDGGTSGPASIRLSLRSMQRDGDPNLYANWQQPAPSSAITSSNPSALLPAALVECDDCSPSLSADMPRDARIATVSSVPLPQDEGEEEEQHRQTSVLFLSVSAGCCWWARYQVSVEPSVQSLRTGPTLITAAHVHRQATAAAAAAASASSEHFYEFLLNIQGEAPVSGRLISRDGAGQDAVIDADSSVQLRDMWCNKAVGDCTIQFPAAAVQSVLCPPAGATGIEVTVAGVSSTYRRQILSLELTYSMGRVVRADLVEGATAALNCTLLSALPVVQLPHRSAATATSLPGADAATPSPDAATASPAATSPTTAAPSSSSSSSSSHSSSPAIARFVTKISKACEDTLRDDYAGSGAWVVPESPILRPSRHCFVEQQLREQESFTTNWLILPSSITDFPVRIAVLVNISYLNITSTRFLTVSFRSTATGATHSCTAVDSDTKNNNGNDDDENEIKAAMVGVSSLARAIIVCDLGGDGAERFIRPQTPLLLQLSDSFAPNGAAGTILLDDVGVVVSPRPQTAGFVTANFDDGDMNDEIAETDFALPPWRTEINIAAVGAYLAPTSWQDAFGVEDSNSPPPAGVSGGATVAPAPQIGVSLRLARLYLVPADNTEQYSLGSFGSLLCNSVAASASADYLANITRRRVSCAVPRERVQCGVPLTLHLSVERALFGSSAEIVPNSVMFPASECGLDVLGIEGPGRAVHGIKIPAPSTSSSSSSTTSTSDTQQTRIAFTIVGQFATVTYAAVSLTCVENSRSSNSDYIFESSTSSSNTCPTEAPECTVRSTATTRLYVTCELKPEHQRNLNPAVYRVAIHGRDISSSSSQLEFTVWTTTRSEQELTLIFMPASLAPTTATTPSPSISSSSSVVMKNLQVVATTTTSGADVGRVFRFEAHNLFLAGGGAGSSPVVGMVSRLPLFLHVRIGEHHSCEIINVTKTSKKDQSAVPTAAAANANVQTFYCVTPVVVVTFTTASAGRRGGLQLQQREPLEARLELWMMGQDLPVFDFGTAALPQKSSSSSNSNHLTSFLTPGADSAAVTANSSNSGIRFAARPSSALLAALSQHHTRRFEVASAVFAPGTSPQYFDMDDMPQKQQQQLQPHLSLFAVTGAAARQNPCRAATSNSLVRSTLSGLHAVRLRRVLLNSASSSSSSSSSGASDVVYPARFDAVSYPCETVRSNGEGDEAENWLHRRAFFVAVCATLNPPSAKKKEETNTLTNFLGTDEVRQGTMPTLPPIQIAEMRPPRFVALHASSVAREAAAGGTVVDVDEEDQNGNGDLDRIASKMRHEVIQLMLPGCDGADAATSGNKEQQTQQQPLLIDRGVILVLGVTVNVALYPEEVLSIQRLNSNSSQQAPPLVKVDRIFFSLDPECKAPLKTSSTTTASSSTSSSSNKVKEEEEEEKKKNKRQQELSVRMNPQLTSLHVHDEHWWSRTTASYTFSAADTLNTAAFEAAAFPATRVFVCATWSGETDALVFTTQRNAQNLDSAATMSSSGGGGSMTNHTARIARARLGACTRDADCDGDDSVCEHRQCKCSPDRRGAWCEKQCPTAAASAVSGGDNDDETRLCSGHGTCNAVAVCECSEYWTGTACSEDLYVASNVALSKAEASSGQARGKMVANMIIKGSSSSSSSSLLHRSTSLLGESLHIALDSLPAGRQLRVVLSSPGFFGDSSASSFFEQKRKLNDGTEVTQRRRPAVLFWTNPLNRSRAAAATPSGSSPVVVPAVADGSSTSYITRSPTFCSHQQQVASPFRALTVFVPAMADMFDSFTSGAVEGSSSSSTSTAAPPPSSQATATAGGAEISIQIEIFMDADAPDTGGCETVACAVLAIVVGVAGAGLGFMSVFMVSKALEQREQKQAEEATAAVTAAAAKRGDDDDGVIVDTAAVVSTSLAAE